MSDASGKLTKTEVARGSVKRSLLDSNDVFIFDIGKSGNFWKENASFSFIIFFLFEKKKSVIFLFKRFLGGVFSIFS